MLRLDRLLRSGQHGIFWLLLLMVVLATAYIPEFRSLGNVINVLNQSAALGILAVGQTFVMAASRTPRPWRLAAASSPI